MAYKLHYSDYPGTDTGPPDPERWVGPPGPPGPVGPMPPGGPFLPLIGGTVSPGPLVIGNGSGSPYLALNGAAGTNKTIYWQNNSTTRWRLQTDASDNLGLYAYKSDGTFLGTTLIFGQADNSTNISGQLITNNSQAGAQNSVNGISATTTNTGIATLSGHRFDYFSSGSNSGFDTGLTILGIYDPVTVAGQTPMYQSFWMVSQSPNNNAANWGCLIGEMNVVNRGVDRGWQRDRTGANPTGGLLMVPETGTFGGTGGGEGKNATWAYSISKSGGTNSTGFPAKFYNGYWIEPNAIAGLTGRAAYWTGDITGVASQYPYGPLQTDGTWLHGIDHTLATYIDGAAETMKANQTLRWIAGGTTASPTGVSTLTGNSIGELQSSASIHIGAGTGTQVLAINGAHGQASGVYWQTAGNNLWQLRTDASDNLFLYSYNGTTGAFIGSILAIASTLFQVQVPCYLGTVGFNGSTPGAKPTVTGSKGANAALASLLTALASYGLVTDSTTA